MSLSDQEHKLSRYPRVTLAEASALLAWGKPARKEVLKRLCRRRPDRKEELYGATAKLTQWMLEGKLPGRGFRQQDEEGGVASEAEDIPLTYVCDGIYVEPLTDTVSKDILLEQHFNAGGFPCFRYVEFEYQQLKKLIECQQPMSQLENVTKQNFAKEIRRVLEFQMKANPDKAPYTKSEIFEGAKKYYGNDVATFNPLDYAWRELASQCAPNWKRRGPRRANKMGPIEVPPEFFEV